jgi:hypothetical protein
MPAAGVLAMLASLAIVGAQHSDSTLVQAEDTTWSVSAGVVSNVADNVADEAVDAVDGHGKAKSDDTTWAKPEDTTW